MQVKLGDMGVCANPTGQFSNNHLGVKRFAPECIVFETRLTEKARTCTVCGGHIVNVCISLYIHVHVYTCVYTITQKIFCSKKFVLAKEYENLTQNIVNTRK